MRTALLLVFLVQMSVSANLVEILFKNNINEAKCSSRCQASTTELEKTQCLNICERLVKKPEDDLCSLSSVCVGGCRIACGSGDDEWEEEDSSVFRHGSITRCLVSWQMERTSRDVVFMVTGRDQAGMWNLIRNTVVDTSMELSYTMAAKMVEIQIFAVGSHRVSDILSVDIRDNDCKEDVPHSMKWREENDRGENISIVNLNIIIGLVLLIVVVATVTITVILVRRLRSRRSKSNDAVPELPYSPPVRTIRDVINVQENIYCNPRVITTIFESDEEYEEVEISSSQIV